MIGRDTLLWGRPTQPENTAQKSILYCLKMLAPFREAQPDGLSSPDLVEGERQFYAFIKGMYVDMYSDPGFFLIPEGVYDDYIEKLGRKGAPGKEASLDPEGSRLWETFQQAIRFYVEYLYQLGVRAENLENGVMSLQTADWKEARKAMGQICPAAESAARFERLQGLGLDERREPSQVLVTSREFPKMLYGLHVLCTAPDEGYRHLNYLRVDFPGALRGRPLLEDIYRTMSPEGAASAKMLEQAALEAGLHPRILPMEKITLGSRWQVKYREGERSVIGFTAGPDHFTLCVYFAGEGEIARVSETLWKKDPKLAAWFDGKFPEGLEENFERGGGPLRGNPRIRRYPDRLEVSRPGWEDMENGLQVFRLVRKIR